MAEARQRDLDIPRARAASLGRTAVEAAEAGFYQDMTGTTIDWSDMVRAACTAKVSVAADAPLPSAPLARFPETRIQVANETTLAASRRFVDAGQEPVALNFANGIHPGGGFLGGARAQEEVLCRSSALYLTLTGDEMYRQHNLRPRPDSSDWSIYTPNVPVFRTDDG